MLPQNKQKGVPLEDHTREIPRLVEPPASLSIEEIRRIGEAVYHAPELQPGDPIDVIFVFGSLHRDFAGICKLYRITGAQLIVATGYRSPKVEVAHGPETYQHLTRLGVPGEQILFEDQAKHTGEDVRNGLELLQRRKLDPRRMVYCCHAAHSGRCYRTLRKSFPETQLAAHVYPTLDGHFPSYRLGPTAWYDHPEVRQRVYGEYLRLELYASRGDIAPL